MGKGMPPPRAYATAMQTNNGTRVMLADYHSDSPLMKLAVALRLRIDQQSMAVTREVRVSITFPFDNFQICQEFETMNLLVRGHVTSVGTEFAIPDPIEGFPSERLVARLNLLRS